MEMGALIKEKVRQIGVNKTDWCRDSKGRVVLFEDVAMAQDYLSAHGISHEDYDRLGVKIVERAELFDNDFTNWVDAENVTEVCPHCDSEIDMSWTTRYLGYKAYCPVCGQRLMLCDACQHRFCTDTVDFLDDCDYDTATDTCRFNTGD